MLRIVKIIIYNNKKKAHIKDEYINTYIVIVAFTYVYNLIQIRNVLTGTLEFKQLN